MGLNVKKVLVILKCPKRGAFLLSREKLQKQNKQKWVYRIICESQPQKSIHISLYLCFIISGQWVVVIISRSEIISTFLLLSFDIFFNADGDIFVTVEEIVIFFEFYFITENNAFSTPGSYFILKIF